MQDNLEKIAQSLEAHIKDTGISQNKLAEIIGISSSYITHIRARNFDKVPAGNNADGSARYTSISSQILKKVSQHLGLENNLWETENYMLGMSILMEAKKYSEHRIISGLKGTGKTFLCEQFLKEFPSETFLITASDDMNPKAFIVEMAHLVGVSTRGDRRTIRLAIAEKIKKMSKPVIIIDEAENLKNATYGSIKALYDDLKDYCGMVLVGANNYLEMLRKKASDGKHCFPQLYSRFSADPAELHLMSLKDVRMVCKLNGIEDKDTINTLNSQCSDYRELDRMIKRIKRDNDLKK